MSICLLPVVGENDEKISDKMENDGMSKVKKGNDEERKAHVDMVDGKQEIKEGKKEIELGKQEDDEAMVEKGEAEHKKGLVAEAQGRYEKEKGEEEVAEGLDDRHSLHIGHTCIGYGYISHNSIGHNYIHRWQRAWTTDTRAL